jgi:hypothetical protein
MGHLPSFPSTSYGQLGRVIEGRDMAIRMKLYG